jgi:hypothetical protein
MSAAAPTPTPIPAWSPMVKDWALLVVGGGDEDVADVGGELVAFADCAEVEDAVLAVSLSGAEAGVKLERSLEAQTTMIGIRRAWKLVIVAPEAEAMCRSVSGPVCVVV